jgi:hypothetical protein
VTNAPSFFLGEADFTHATQDRDHDAPSSQMITITTSPRRQGRGEGRQHHLAPRRIPSSIQSGSESFSSYAHGYPKYLAPDPSTVVHDVQWVYECESSKILLYIGLRMTNSHRIDGANLRWLQGKLDGKSSYHTHVSQRLSYDKLHLDDDSMSYMYFELMY